MFLAFPQNISVNNQELVTQAILSMTDIGQSADVKNDRDCFSLVQFQVLKSRNLVGVDTKNLKSAPTPAFALPYLHQESLLLLKLKALLSFNPNLQFELDTYCAIETLTVIVIVQGFNPTVTGLNGKSTRYALGREQLVPI